MAFPQIAQGPSWLVSGTFVTSTLTGNATLTFESAQLLSYDPGGASRDVTLPAIIGSAKEKGTDWRLLYNSADADGENLVVKKSGGATLHTVQRGEFVLVAVDYDAADYAVVAATGQPGADFGAVGIDTDVIKESTSGAGVTIDVLALIKDGTLTLATTTKLSGEGAAAGGKLELAEATANGTSVVTFQAPAALGAARAITIPDADVDLTDVNTMAGAAAQALDAAASPTFASMVLTGDLVVMGDSVKADLETVELDANYLIQNTGYTTAVGVTGGRAINYLPTATADTTTGAGVVVAGVPATSDPTITTVGAATFADKDLVLISGSDNNGENDGIYEVLSHAANLLTLKGGLTPTVVPWTSGQLVANAGDVGMAITKVTVAVDRAGTDGRFEAASGSDTDMVFSDYLLTSELGNAVQAYDASLLSLAALATAADKLPYATALDTYAEADFTAFARTLLDDATAAAAATTLGLGTGDTPTFTDVGVAADAAASGTGVVATSEQLQVRTLLLTLTATPVVMADNAGVVAYGSLKVADLPAGNIVILGAVMDLALTLSAAGINADWDGDVGLGTVAANNGAGPLAGTEQDIIPNTATPQAVASATTAKAMSTAVELAAGVWDGTTGVGGTPKDIYLNLLVDDADHDVTTTPTNIICDGTIKLTYVNLGDIA